MAIGVVPVATTCGSDDLAFPLVVGAPGNEGYGELLQGFLESSNVNPVSEITALITAQRAYDLNSKVITASDEMMATVSQLR